MVRWNVLAAGMMVVGSMAFVAGSSVPPKPAESQIKQDTIKAIPVTNPKLGFFNMAKVMKEYHRARTAVQRLNERRERMTRNINGMREMWKELDATSKSLSSNHWSSSGSNITQQIADHKVMLSRTIEDAEREMNQLLNKQATTIIGELYDEIYATTAGLARERGLSAIIAYPDASTPEERDNPQVKEMKLKPPAAQPFFIDTSVEFTDDILDRLNARSAAEAEDK